MNKQKRIATLAGLWALAEVGAAASLNAAATPAVPPSICSRLAAWYAVCGRSDAHGKPAYCVPETPLGVHPVPGSKLQQPTAGSLDNIYGASANNWCEIDSGNG